jgi:hypothetical protein
MVPELDANQVQFQRIVSSKAFKTSEVHRNLLNYLAEKSLSGTAQNLKEYTVGLDVFGKPATYDPRQESVVRMHVGRLRQKLSEYYRTEGLDDPVVVDLPKGAFTLTFAPRPDTALPEPMVPPGRTTSPREIALAVSLLLAILFAGYFGVRLSRMEKTAAAGPSLPWTPDLQQLWGPLLSSDRPLMVTLSTDPFHASAQGVVSVRRRASQAWAPQAAFLLGCPAGASGTCFRSAATSCRWEIAMGDVIFVGSTVGSRKSRIRPSIASS